jgi:hypothetical protein
MPNRKLRPRLRGLRGVSIYKLIPDEETAREAMGYYCFGYPPKCKVCWSDEALLVRRPNTEVYACKRCKRRFKLRAQPEIQVIRGTHLEFRYWFYVWYFSRHKKYGYRRLVKTLKLNRNTVKRVSKLVSNDLFHYIVSWYMDIKDLQKETNPTPQRS